MRNLCGGRIALHQGDCRNALKTIPDASIDSIVTDPPYGIGFMGRAWDAKDGAPFAVEFWREALRVLKPGGHVAAFAGTRTYHRLACAVEDAGFEIRDQLAWTYGTGFPKSRNLGSGRGTALKPAWEPILLARRPLSEPTVAANLLKHETGALNVDACRISTTDTINQPSTKGTLCGSGGWDRPWKSDASAVAARDRRAREAITKAELLGRFPANIVHDGSDEVARVFPNGSARFFYSTKANKHDRAGSAHPTVKPVDLMRWLCRLITPLGGVVLDPFAGSGTTGTAAYLEGFRAVLCEREPEYQQDIVSRLEALVPTDLLSLQAAE